jgi:hypothetical protein
MADAIGVARCSSLSWLKFDRIQQQDDSCAILASLMVDGVRIMRFCKKAWGNVKSETSAMRPCASVVIKCILGKAR